MCSIIIINCMCYLQGRFTWLLRSSHLFALLKKKGRERDSIPASVIKELTCLQSLFTKTINTMYKVTVLIMAFKTGAWIKVQRVASASPPACLSLCNSWEMTSKSFCKCMFLVSVSSSIRCMRRFISLRFSSPLSLMKSTSRLTVSFSVDDGWWLPEVGSYLLSMQ